MNRFATRIAAAALAAAALAPWAAVAAPAAEATRLTAAAEERLAALEKAGAAAEETLAALEKAGAAAEETPARRAARRLEEGTAQYAVGDWVHAALLLAGAVDEPAFRGSPDRGEALFLLADALRRQGACGAARARFAEYLALGAVARRRDVVSGALDCAVKEHRSGDVEELLREAERAFAGNEPPEVRYLAAKAIFQRTDLPPRERIERAAAAFARVGPPFQLQAFYFLGVLELQRENLHGSLQWFDACARPEARDPRQQEVRELCMLALGRVHAQMGNAAAAVGWYAAVPPESRHFGEALYELAWSYVKGERFSHALRMASFIAELEPESPLAPEATVLRGHLLLRLGRYGEATDAYNHVINTYAPVRDEIDAILAMHEDPVRYLNELVGRSAGAFDVASVLPPVAVRWASTKGEVASAIRLVQSLDAARRDLRASAEVAERIEALLARGGGLDAFPALRQTYAGTQAVENDVAEIEGALVGALSTIAEPALSAERRAELGRAREAREKAEARMRALPRTPRDAEARISRMRARLDGVDRSAFQLGLVLRSLEAAIASSQAWIESHRAEIDAEPEGRREFLEEMRRHAEVVQGYGEELRALRLEIARARDAAGGADGMGDEARIRAEALAAIEAEREVAATARGSLADADRVIFDRADRLRERLASLRSRARAAALGLVSEAGRRAGELRDRVAAERAALAGNAGALDGVQTASKELVGQIVLRSFDEVRAQFYRLVLKADVGIVDVAWSRKRARLDKIQQLSVQKATEIEQIEREYRGLSQEAD